MDTVSQDHDAIMSQRIRFEAVTSGCGCSDSAGCNRTTPQSVTVRSIKQPLHRISLHRGVLTKRRRERKAKVSKLTFIDIAAILSMFMPIECRRFNRLLLWIAIKLLPDIVNETVRLFHRDWISLKLGFVYRAEIIDHSAVNRGLESRDIDAPWDRVCGFHDKVITTTVASSYRPIYHAAACSRSNVNRFCLCQSGIKISLLLWLWSTMRAFQTVPQKGYTTERF